MKARITAKAPTGYQLGSLTAFGMPYKKNGNGSIIAMRDFESVGDAKAYLRERAEMYNDADPNGSEERLTDMCRDIEDHGILHLDAATAIITEIESSELL